MNRRVRVLVIDDSAFSRRTIIKMLETVPEVEVIGYAVDGEEGLRKFLDLRPDLVTLDLEMPRMDGFTFLRFLMQHRPTPVIVVSARSDDENVFKALEFGAVEFIAKPSSRVSPELSTIQQDLTGKVLNIARSADMKKVLRRSAPGATAPPLSAPVAPPAAESEPRKGGYEMVAIGASTGGPPALQAILAAIDRPLPVAFAVSQHMPAGFTHAFAERLNRFCSLEVKEARSGDLVRPGLVLVAPGGKNLLFRRRGERVLAHVVDPDPGQRYVPSIDEMFISAGKVYGTGLLGVVLTGMGNDGARGTAQIHNRGGRVLAEAEETSVVFGMPKEAIATGMVEQVVALPAFAGEILRRCGG